MNLYKIGDTVINMDRVNGIQDHQAPIDPRAPAGQTVVRVLFDNTTLDLVGREARTFRQWFRHTARNLAPHKDEDGEELIAPEEQLKRASEHLLGLIDHARPRDTAVRHAAHRLAGMIDEYITGELQPARARSFERILEPAHAKAQPAPDSSSEAPPAQG